MPDKNGRIRFEGGDYRYLARVRRLSPGEYFPALLPGADDTVNVRVLSVNKNVLVGEISAEKTAPGAASASAAASAGADIKSHTPIYLFQSLPKGEKMDLIVRQAAEGGIEQIVPFTSEFSAVKNIKNTGLKFLRWERIIKEARQQSGSKARTAIQQPLSIDGLFAFWGELTAQKPGALGLLFHHLPLANSSLHEYLYKETEIVALAVGPEGGFSDSEARRFMSAGFRPVTIGDTILRAETAALYAHAVVRTLLLERDSWQTK